MKARVSHEPGEQGDAESHHGEHTRCARVGAKSCSRYAVDCGRERAGLKVRMMSAPSGTRSSGRGDSEVISGISVPQSWHCGALGRTVVTLPCESQGPAIDFCGRLATIAAMVGRSPANADQTPIQVASAACSAVHGLIRKDTNMRARPFDGFGFLLDIQCVRDHWLDSKMPRITGGC